ncbi:MAG: InlB B-repeat-containing protein [Treponema sp.]|jgi:hypothetical protein|nr:InlB B-repeat-containing protein [Treponema sp.]
MKKNAICALVLFGLIFFGCDDTSENGPESSAKGSYTVTFKGTASNPSNQTISAWEKISKPADPAAPDSAAFKGWYKDGRLPWNFTTDQVTSNMTLCAGWSFNTIAALEAFLSNPSTAGAARHMSPGTDPNPDKYPIPVALSIQLTQENWKNLVKAIESKGKKVSLDLSACTVSGASGNDTSTVAAERHIGGLWADGTFQSIDTGLNAAFTGSVNTRVTNTIAALILPDGATKLVEATANINLIHAIMGRNVTRITYTANASFHGGRLTEAYFPKITDIGTALEECQYLETAYLPEVTKLEADALRYTYTAGAKGLSRADIPKAAEIGDSAFGSSGNADLTITLGPTPPKLGKDIFNGISVLKKVTVRVPAANKAAYTADWVKGLTGKGWENGTLKDGPVKRNIIVTIIEY